MDYISIGLFVVIGLTVGFIVGQVVAFTLKAGMIYKQIIQPALRDCIHPDYYYQDSHRPLCDALGVNATK